MLPRQFRLQKSKDIKQVIQKGFRFRGRHLQLTVLKNSSKATRIAFVVSNRISKKATVRNRAKRLMREATRSLLSLLMPGYDIIVWAQSGIQGQTKDQIQEELLFCFSSMRIVHS